METKEGIVMKANEIPERIYISLIPSISGGYVYTTVNKNFPNAVEYTRTDAFIEKACEWLRKNADNYTWYDETEHESGMTDEFIDVFKNYMKGE